MKPIHERVQDAAMAAGYKRLPFSNQSPWPQPSGDRWRDFFGDQSNAILIANHLLRGVPARAPLVRAFCTDVPDQCRMLVRRVRKEGGEHLQLDEEKAILWSDALATEAHAILGYSRQRAIYSSQQLAAFLELEGRDPFTELPCEHLSAEELREVLEFVELLRFSYPRPGDQERNGVGAENGGGRDRD